MEVGSQKSDVRSQMSEVRKKKAIVVSRRSAIDRSAIQNSKYVPAPSNQYPETNYEFKKCILQDIDIEYTTLNIENFLL